MQIADKYSPAETEQRWYRFWQDKKYFHSTPDERPPYTIVIPPPNVTGILHMGHMLNNTIQDVLVRRARMTGYNACWVPGTDHASIATEAKVVAKLKAEGIEKRDLSREEFLSHAWDWTEKYGGTILDQLKKLGCSCDWDRTRFTMEPKLSAQVIKSFVDLYNKGLIYRGYRIINWDPEAKTNISDEEVIYKEQQGKLYHLRYRLENSEEYLTVATTRPETVFGDVAVAVNPEDPRFAKWIGKNVIVPVVGRAVPVIADAYVDAEFGTGALKITPAHDVNDYEIGLRHNLPVIDSLDDDGKMTAVAMHYAGEDRFTVRKKIAAEMQDLGLLEKAEDYINKVGTSERTGAVIEPKISMQWFLKMESLAGPALEAVERGEITLFPDRFRNTYRHWLENIRDWNISRQLWWGQQIPAWYVDIDGNSDKTSGLRGEIIVAENEEEAQRLALERFPALLDTDYTLRQDEDVLDTWFSSWLWPISVFDGLLDPENEDIKYYYPTSDLVTGPDIIFFWVARMVMAGLEFRGKIPFENVYFTGIVRDKQRRKMSKSLGNSPDPLELIEKYGADGVRVGILLSSSAGNDLLFDEDLMLQGRNFATKIWNAYRLVSNWSTHTEASTEAEKDACHWMRQAIAAAQGEVKGHFERFRISDALHVIYKLIWDDFCSWYLEIIKPAYGAGISRQTKDEVLDIFEHLLILLHPYMPFLTEEIWQTMHPRTDAEALIITQQRPLEITDPTILADFEKVKEIISGVRNYRQSNGISPKEPVELYSAQAGIPYPKIVKKMAHIENLHVNAKPETASYIFLVGAEEFSIPFSEKIDVEAERQKTLEEIIYLEGFLNSVTKKLSNEKFVSNAKPEIVENERKKQRDAEEKLNILRRKLQ